MLDDRAAGKITGLAEALKKGFRDATNMHSPSRDFFGYGGSSWPASF